LGQCSSARAASKWSSHSNRTPHPDNIADAAASLDAETFERAGELLHAPSQSSATIAVIAQA
jgi:hypothetical protein